MLRDFAVLCLSSILYRITCLQFFIYIFLSVLFYVFVTRESPSVSPFDVLLLKTLRVHALEIPCPYSSHQG